MRKNWKARGEGLAKFALHDTISCDRIHDLRFAVSHAVTCSCVGHTIIDGLGRRDNELVLYEGLGSDAKHKWRSAFRVRPGDVSMHAR